MIRGVLFDLGGTLHTSTMPAGRDLWFAKRLLGRLADYGIVLETTPEKLAEELPVLSEEYKHVSELDLKEMAPADIWNDYFLRPYHIGRDRLLPFAEELSFLYDYERPCVMRRPGLYETMETLHGRGLKLGMISNIISRSVVPHFLAEYDIDRFMSCVITSAQTGIRKPSPEIFRAAEKAVGLGPGELAYVGDTISRDVIGTRRAGWKLMIRIRYAGTAHRDTAFLDSGYEPDVTIDELTEIPDIIEAFNRAERDGSGLPDKTC